MADQAVETIIIDKLRAELGPIPYVEARNETPQASDLPDRFVTCLFDKGFREQICFGSPGNNLYREDGTAHIYISGRVGEDISKLMAVAEDLENVFFNFVALNFEVLTVQPPYLMDVEDFEIDFNGAWAFVDLAIDYRFDSFA